MKKVLVTRKLLRSNEERMSKLWEAKLNLNDEIYSSNKLIVIRTYGKFVPVITYRAPVRLEKVKNT